MGDAGKIVSFQQNAGFLHERAVQHRDKDPLRALDLLHHAIELSPDEAVYRLEEAELLSEMGCINESILSIARTTACSFFPPDLFFGLACNLASVGLVEAAACSLSLYLQSDVEGEYAQEALQMLSSLRMAEEIGRPKARRERRAYVVLKQVANQMRENRYEQARQSLLKVLRLNPRDRRAASMLVQCDMQTGRYEQAYRMIERLSPGENPDGILHLALVLSEHDGQQDRIQGLFDLLGMADMDVERRATQFQVYLNLERGDMIHRMLPDLMGEAPFDRQLLHAAAVDALKNGLPTDTAHKYWKRMQCIRPADGVSAYYLEHSSDVVQNIPYRLGLPMEASQCMLKRCSEPGEDLFSLAYWAMDVLEEEALWRICPALSASPQREAELVLREMLAQPHLSAKVKLRALSALGERQAHPPYLYVTTSQVYLLDGSTQLSTEKPSRSLYRLLWRAEEAIDEVFPAGQEALVHLWAEMMVRYDPVYGIRRLDRMAPALIALSIERCGAEVDFGYLSRHFEMSERHIYHDMERLRPLVGQRKPFEEDNTDEMH